MEIITKVSNDEIKRRMRALKNAQLSIDERASIMNAIKRKDKTLDNYLAGKGGNYGLNLDIIIAGELVISKRCH